MKTTIENSKMSTATSRQGVHILKQNQNISSFIQDIANISDQEKGFIVCDIGEIIARYLEWKDALPRVTPFFAVKCNDDSTVLETLSALGAGFDCSSKLEIDKVLALGVSTDRIVFSHTTKLISYIRYAAERDVSLMTFDNEEELHKIKKYYPNSRLVLRFRCDDETAIAKLGIKYGCDPENEAEELLKIARNLQLDVVGVCFHVGSYSRNPKIFSLALRYAREIFDVAKNNGYNFSILDIGGGYPGIREATIDVFAKVINEALEKHFPDPDLKIISEPGSFLVSTSGTIATNIHSLRSVKEKDDSGNLSMHNMYYINDGYYGSFNCWLTHSCALYVEPLKANTKSELIKSTIWGPTCDCKDKVWEGFLPQMKVGEWIIFHDMGDYTFKAASEFNGFLKPDVHFVISESKCNYLRKMLPFTTADFLEDNDCVI